MHQMVRLNLSLRNTHILPAQKISVISSLSPHMNVLLLHWAIYSYITKNAWWALGNEMQRWQTFLKRKWSQPGSPQKSIFSSAEAFKIAQLLNVYMHLLKTRISVIHGQCYNFFMFTKSRVIKFWEAAFNELNTVEQKGRKNMLQLSSFTENSLLALECEHNSVGCMKCL